MTHRPRPNTAAPDLTADRKRALELVPVSRETAQRLDCFVELLLDWQQRTNLIASSTIPIIWTRHIADSLQLLALAPGAKRWIDLGSGAGFPGIVVACALADTPGAKIHLVESSTKKAAFLSEAARLTAAPVQVHPVRIEDFVQNFSEPIEAVTARALAPLQHLLRLAYPLMKPGVVGLFPKGQDVDAELTEASKCWNIDADLVPSKTHPQSRIVVVRRLQKGPGPK